jgi:hydrophobe/amphiphile efflux-1 (HAE1) family protein
MLSKFFIYRPIFASVISIVFVLAGLITLMALPVAQYPNLEPPTVTVTAVYPGASAKVVADTVAAPIEQEVNGVEGMIYMSSQSAADGSYTLTVTFATGSNLDMAQVLVQNRVSIALPKLPEDVRRTGVTTKKKSPNFALLVALHAPDERFDDIFLSNYATLNLRDELSRVYGVGDVVVFGAGDYSMRIWLDPEQLKARALTTQDVANAIQEQNVQVAAGVIGQPPAPKGTAFQLTVNALGRLEDVKQFENIIIKTGRQGQITRLKDVARVQLGSKTYTQISQLNQKPSALIMVYQLPGANLLNISSQCKEVIERLSQRFPQGLEYVIGYDASDVVHASINEIVETLIIASILVILTVFVFLQDFRATLIPSVTIPVSLIGTFAVMGILGFSINTLTLFGLVLAIGIVVDDAIVVVENVSRNIDETGMSAKEASVKAMEEITGAVVATTLVLLAVFIPTAFMGGITGIMYQQFALTIAVATVFSSINALTMSPALCGMVMRPTPQRRKGFFKGFNWLLDHATTGYTKIVKLAIRRLLFAAVAYGGICLAAYWGMSTTPSGFVPVEDQGYASINIQLPDGASLQRTRAVLDKVNEIVANTKGIKYNLGMGGYSLLDGTNQSNMAGSVIVFEPWDQRTEPDVSQEAIIGNLRRKFANIQEAIVVAFIPPALPGLGLAGGFEMLVQDRGNLGLPMLQNVANELVDDGNTQDGLVGLYTSFRANVPQLFVDVDRDKVISLDVPLSSVFYTLQAYLGSAYVNDFNKFGRTYQVNIQADAKFRARASDIRALEVRNRQGGMLPLGTLASVEETFGPQVITRYNMYTSASVRGSPAAGFSSGQAMALMADLCKEKLPASMNFEWTGVSFQEQAAGSGAGMVLVMAAVFVFLVLAAQYESWKLPAPVLLSVPIALLGAFLAIKARGLDNNVYTQIGLVLLIGLASKNAILIVEFARDKYKEGMSIADAALEASRLRFRPILMTAFSFILGVIPLLIATGAGAGSRVALGTAVFGGMLAATAIGVILVPPIYTVFQRMGESRKIKKAQQALDSGEAAEKTE